MEALRALTAKRLARTRVNSDQYSAKLSLFEVSLDIEERVMKITWYDSTVSSESQNTLPTRAVTVGY